MSDLIRRADVLKYPIRLDHYDEVNGSREFVYGVESVIEYVESLPSADTVSREFYEDAVKANIGLVIENRKLKEQIESADAVDVYKAHEEEHLNIINRIKELQYAIAKTQTIVGKLVESADAVQGEWLNGWEVIRELSETRCMYNCFDENDRPMYEAMTSAIDIVRQMMGGARMKGGAE